MQDTERIEAWQCIGCGRIESPQECIGVCKDRRVELVSASDHAGTLAELALAQRRLDELMALVRALACTSPRPGQWEKSYRALQRRARRLLFSNPVSREPA